LVRAGGATVQGVLYRLSLTDRLLLDRYEGVPLFYQRVAVSLRDENGRRRRAHAYVLTGRQPAAPSTRYLGVITRAYARLGFDRRPLARAARDGTRHASP
jgi:cation transport regulator ChaC